MLRIDENGSITMIRGDDEGIAIVSDGEYFAPGDVITMTVREDPESPVVIQIRTEVQEGDDLARIPLPIRHEDTAALDFGSYVYDIELVRGERHKTLIFAKFKLKPEVTY